MSQINGNLIGNFFLIIFGLCLIIFYKTIGQKTVEFWAKITPIRSSVKASQIIFLIAGVISIILGLLALANIIKFK